MINISLIKNRKAHLVLLILLTLLAASFYAYANRNRPAVNRPDLTTEVQKIAPPKPIAVESRILIVGDIFWGRNNQRLSEQSSLGIAYSFSKLSTFNKANYDAWVGNLECPVTDTEISFTRQSQDLIFNCQPKYLPEASKWFEVVSLANNHTDNVNGISGLEETRRHLDEYGIQYFGSFDPSVKQDQCEVIALPARVLYDNGSEQSVSLPIAFCGYQYVYGQPKANDFDKLKQFATYLPAISVPHMGAEYVASADEIKTTSYRRMVDNGADLVVGGHPHWVQNAEVYKGKLIMYSLGNFLFDQAWSTEVKKGLTLDMLIHIKYDANIASWIDIGPECVKFQDDCLARAVDEQLTKPKAQFVYNIIASQYDNGQTFKATQEVQAQMESRTNWGVNSLKLNPHD